MGADRVDFVRSLGAHTAVEAKDAEAARVLVDDAEALAAVGCFSIVATLFVIAPFSFGYFLGFYFYTMILGYLWLIEFSRLSYIHSLAIVSIFLSALAFLAPALSITAPISPRFALPARAYRWERNVQRRP